MNQYPSARDVLQSIQEPSAYAGNPPWWEEAMAAMPGRLPFLESSSLSARRSAAGLPSERDPQLARIAGIVAADWALRCFAWYLHWRMFVVPERGRLRERLDSARRLGELAGMFYQLLALEFPVRLRTWHKQLGYPESITHQTLQQIACMESNHLRGLGLPGIYENQFSWLATYLIHPYVRLGRLEYQLHPYVGGVSVWRQAADGQAVALVPEGVRVSTSGLVLPPDAPDGEGWTAHLQIAPDAVQGHPVDPVGRILSTTVRLDRPDWECCLDKGDPVLNMHIPSGGGMDWESMRSSFRQAAEFFGLHHADRPFRALVLRTWFMDPQLAEVLPQAANPLRLQRAGYLYPFAPDPAGLWFVFLRDTAKPDAAMLPRKTSLQTAIAGFLEKGGTWNGGGMFLLPEAMLAPQEGWYRDRFRALMLES